MASALAGRAHSHMQSPLLQVWLGPPCDSDLQQASRAAAASAAAATAARRGDADDSSHSSGVWKTYPLRKRFSAFRLAGASSDAPKGDGGLVPSPPRPPPPSYQQHQQHQLQLQQRECAEEGDGGGSLRATRDCGAKGLSAADVAPRKRKAAVALFACGPPRGAVRRSHKRRGAPSSDDDDDDDYEEEEDGYDVGGWAARLPGVRRRNHSGHGQQQQQQQHEPNHRWRGLREAPDDGQPVRKRRVASLNAEALVNLLLERDDDDLALAAPCVPQPAPPVPERHRAAASGSGGSGVQRQQQPQQQQQQQQQQPRGSSTLVNRRSPCLAASAGPGQDCSLAQGSMLSETDAASLHPPASAVAGGAPGVERAEAEAFANSRADACKCPFAASRDGRRPPVVVSAASSILSAAASAAASAASGAMRQSKSGGDGVLAAQGVGYQQTAGTLPQAPWNPPAEPLDCRRIAPPPPSFSVPYSGCFLTGVGFQPSVTAGGVDFVPAASSSAASSAASSSAVDDDVPLDLSMKRPGADRSRAADKRPPYDLGPGARPLRTGMTLEPAPTSRRNRTHPSLLGPRLFASRLAVVPRPPQPPRLRLLQPRAPHGFADAMAPSLAYSGRNLSYTGTYFFGPGSSPPLLPCHRQGHEPTWRAEPGSGCYGSRWDEQPPPPKIPKLDFDRIPSTSTSSSSSSPQLPPDTLHRDSTTTPCLQPPPPPPPLSNHHHQDHHGDVNDNNRRHHHSDRHSPSDSHGHKHKHGHGGHGNHHKDDGAQSRRRDSSCEPSAVPAEPTPPCAPEGRAERRGATGRFCRSLSVGAACGPPGERPLRLEERPSPPSSGDGTARRNERPPLPKIVIKKWALACGVADDGSTPRTPRTPQLTSPAEGNAGRRLRVGQRRATGSGSKWFPVGKAFEKAVYVVGEAELAVRRCFSAVRCAGLVVRVRDCVLLRSGARRRSLPFVAKISALWEDPRSGELTMSLFWYYRPEHTQGGRPAYKHCEQSEIFASRHQDVNSVACIEEKCYVLTFAEYCRFWADIERRREGLAAGAPTTEASGTGLLPPPPPTVPPHPAGCSAPLHRRVPPNTDPELVFLSRAVYDFRHHRLLKNPFRPALSPVPR